MVQDGCYGKMLFEQVKSQGGRVIPRETMCSFLYQRSERVGHGTKVPYEPLIKVSKYEEALQLLQGCGSWPITDCFDLTLVHRNSVWADDIP